MGMPEVFYGANHCYFACPEKNFILDICNVASISYSAFAKRDAYLRPKTLTESCVEANADQPKPDEKAVNLIDFIPVPIKVKESEHWDKRKEELLKIKDFHKLEIISDWTFSSPYKGTLGFLSQHADRIK
jgi:hypothetical protein